MDEQKSYLHAFSFIPGLGPKKLNQLITYFDQDAQQAWNQFSPWIKKLITSNYQNQAYQIYKTISPQTAWEELLRDQIETTSIRERTFPHFLKQINDPPVLLYYKGILPQRLSPLITIVGSRKMSPYGQHVIEELVAGLKGSGIGVISGLALGVDAQAHQSSLNNQLYTLGILGSGLNKIQPSRNYNLSQQMLANGGCILSEFTQNTEGSKSTFPRRNRLLAGISPLTIIIEAATRSGALITANLALDYNRDVFAVPGSIFSPTSTGCNKLIQTGAHPILDAEQILTYFDMERSSVAPVVVLSKKEEQLLDLFSGEPLTFDELVDKSSFFTHELPPLLTELELKKILIKQSNGRYRTKRPV